MTGYLSRLVSRLGISDTREGDVQGVITPPVSPLAAPVDSFEMTAAEEAPDAPPAPLSNPDRTPPPAPLTPPKSIPTPPIAAALPVEHEREQEAHEADDSVKAILVAPALPLAPTPALQAISTERIVTVERSTDAPPVMLPPPTMPDVPAPTAGTLETENDARSPVLEAPASRVVEVARLSPEVRRERDDDKDAKRDIAAYIEPPHSEPVPSPEPITTAESPTITIGDVVVEIVAINRPPEVRRNAASPPSRPASSPAPRPGVRSKRGYGIGQG